MTRIINSDDWKLEKCKKTFFYMTVVTFFFHILFHYILLAVTNIPHDSLLNRVSSSFVMLSLYLISNKSEWGKKHVYFLFNLSTFIIFLSTYALVYFSNFNSVYVSASIIVVSFSSLIFYRLIHHVIVQWSSFAIFILITYLNKPYDTFFTALISYMPVLIIAQIVTERNIHLHDEVSVSYNELSRKKLELEQALKNLTEVKEHVMQKSQIAVMNKFSAGLAHSVNNSLTISYLSVDNILKKVKNNSIDMHNLDRSLMKIISSNDRIRKIVTKLKQISSPERLNTQEYFQFNESWLDIIETFVPIADELGIIIKTQNAPNILITSNRSSFELALFNFFNNSFENLTSTKDPWINVEFEKKDKAFIINITESTIFDPDSAELIFVPFYQISNKDMESNINLAIVKKLITSQGGDIKLASCSPNTHFQISIPFS